MTQSDTEALKALIELAQEYRRLNDGTSSLRWARSAALRAFNRAALNAIPALERMLASQGEPVAWRVTFPEQSVDFVTNSKSMAEGAVKSGWTATPLFPPWIVPGWQQELERICGQVKRLADDWPMSKSYTRLEADSIISQLRKLAAAPKVKP